MVFTFSSPSQPSPPPSPLSPIGVIALLVIYVLISYLVIVLESLGDGNRINGVEGRINTGAPRKAGCKNSGISLDELQKIPCSGHGHGWRRSQSQSSGCAICLEGIRPGEQCRVLPGCTHVFHVECVDPWLTRSLTCPVCRTRFNIRYSLEVAQSYVVDSV
uniref:RING-type domain-containing protein n=1 Tax=Nelumbo nucifera TaxID=4432 RepID=A0A822ZGD2_NELNU|nr:TPA_asm: hypothetical protein HUJ06_015021 [Nelumbo nucifera]